MHPDDLPGRILRSLPPPPETLRARILSTAKARWQQEKPQPWWLQVRTWAAAAVIMAACDAAVIAGVTRQSPSSSPESTATARRSLPADAPTLLALTRTMHLENRP
jgi:negative regulator of sigma E activity